MIRTVVCHKDKCHGNKFNINTVDNVIEVICTECKEKYRFDTKYYDVKFLPNCSVCNHDSFKVFRDVETGEVYAKCHECGNPPEKIYIDSDGVQVSYNEKLLYDVKELMVRIDQKMMNLEIAINEVERGQQILEQSIAYINKFMVEQK